MIAMCLLNIVGFGLEDYSYRINESEKSNIRNFISNVLLVICEITFLFDIIIEFIARRIKGKRGIIKDPWYIANSVSIICTYKIFD